MCDPRMPEGIAVKCFLERILSKMIAKLLFNNPAGEQLSTNIARFNNGQNNGCVGDSRFLQIFFDNVILQSSINGNW